MKTKYIQVTISVLLLTGFFYLIDTNEMFFVISYSDKWSFFLACILSFCGNAARDFSSKLSVLGWGQRINK